MRGSIISKIELPIPRLRHPQSACSSAQSSRVVSHWPQTLSQNQNQVRTEAGKSQQRTTGLDPRTTTSAGSRLKRSAEAQRRWRCSCRGRGRSQWKRQSVESLIGSLTKPQRREASQSWTKVAIAKRRRAAFGRQNLLRMSTGSVSAREFFHYPHARPRTKYPVLPAQRAHHLQIRVYAS
jgi:hypothetical protein